MIKLTEVNEFNWIEVGKLEVEEHQKKYVGTPVGILARAYAYRNSRAKAMFIEVDESVVGMMMVRDMEEEPKCYDLQQFLIDKHHQGKGYGKAALKTLIDMLYEERKYDVIEVCVEKEDTAAVRLYMKTGFVDSGYVDPDAPSSLNLSYKFG